MLWKMVYLGKIPCNIQLLLMRCYHDKQKIIDILILYSTVESNLKLCKTHFVKLDFISQSIVNIDLPPNVFYLYISAFYTTNIGRHV